MFCIWNLVARGTLSPFPNPEERGNKEISEENQPILPVQLEQRRSVLSGGPPGKKE